MTPGDRGRGGEGRKSRVPRTMPGEGPGVAAGVWRTWLSTGASQVPEDRAVLRHGDVSSQRRAGLAGLEQLREGELGTRGALLGARGLLGAEELEREEQWTRGRTVSEKSREEAPRAGGLAASSAPRR